MSIIVTLNLPLICVQFGLILVMSLESRPTNAIPHLRGSFQFENVKISLKVFFHLSPQEFDVVLSFQEFYVLLSFRITGL